RLLELLVQRLPDGVPPRIVTAGVLVDELVGARGRVAGRMARTMAWAAALASLPAERLAEFAPRPPPVDDLQGWRELGALARGLHGTLAAADRDFSDAVEPAGRLCGAEEAQRWRVLELARAAYLRRLEVDGVVDPHESRRGAVHAGTLKTGARVVLVGVVEAAGLMRAALRTLDHTPEALVFAPLSEAARYDALGCARPVPLGNGVAATTSASDSATGDDAPLFSSPCSASLEPDGAGPLRVLIDDARWFVEDRPDDQAERVMRVLAKTTPARPTAEITVGLLDTQVGPPLARRLADHGVSVRDVAGTPMTGTSPAQLMAATADWLDGRGVDAFAALVRHPDVSWGVSASDATGDDSSDAAGDADTDPRLSEPATAGHHRRCLASDLDAYRAQHLPAHVKGPWLALGKDLDLGLAASTDGASRHERREAIEERDRRRALVSASRAWDAQLGELADGRPRPLFEWAAPLRTWLAAVYAGRQLNPMARKADRRLAAALRAVSSALDEMAAARAWKPAVSAAAAMTELWAALEKSPPVPPAPDDDAIELLGWLELPLDDAPLLVLTGLNDGNVPEPVSEGDLPEALCSELGLPDDVARTARDALLLSSILHSRAVSLVTGKRSRENDPLLPSRLLFACDDEQLVARVEALVAAGERRPAAAPTPARVDAPRALPMARTPPPVTKLSATAFKAYLNSPYRFYLERVLHLSGVDDDAAEMNPLIFGSLAHAVLEGLADDKAGSSTRAHVIDEFLQRRLDGLVAERFGKTSLPAVTLQLMQLRKRLTAFASWQAGWAEQGWRIRHAEWAPSRPATLDVDGEPFVISGIIDRIDENERTGQWAILDYKTSEVGADPAKTHRGWSTVPDEDNPGEQKRVRVWVDLQLPLYRVLAGELGLPDEVRLGYINLPADLDDVGAVLVEPEDGKQGRRKWEGWTPQRLDDALELAREIIRAVRAGAFSGLGEVTHHRADEPLVRALAGLDLLSAPAPELEDDDAAEDGGAS
ncbi:MAG: hypothetical protein DRQ55_17665, partial [Planctomycetota bacterium]